MVLTFLETRYRHPLRPIAAMRTGRNDRRGPARCSTVLAFLVAGMGSLSCVDAWNSLAADVRDAGRDAMDFASIIGGAASVTEPESIRRQGRWPADRIDANDGPSQQRPG